MRSVFACWRISDNFIDPRHSTKVGLIGQIKVNRREIVDTCILHGMAGVIEKMAITSVRAAREKSIVTWSMPDLSRSKLRVTSNPERLSEAATSSASLCGLSRRGTC